MPNLKIAGQSSNQIVNDLLQFVEPGDTILIGFAAVPYVVEAVHGPTAADSYGYQEMLFDIPGATVRSGLCDIPEDVATRLLPKLFAGSQPVEGR